MEVTARSSDAMHGTYVVQAGDSLMSIAAKVGNVTPAQLARFNKLGMLGVSQPPIFPGQSLYIPNSEELANQNVRLRSFPGTATRIAEQVSSKPSDFPTSPSPLPSSRHSCSLPLGERDSGIGVQERLFVKFKAKRVLLPSKTHIDGILIATPDAICFDALATATALDQALLKKKRASNSASSDLLDVRDDKSQSSILPLPDQSQFPPAELKMVAHNPNPVSERIRLSSSPTIPIIPACTPVHDVLSLSVCIPVYSVISLNTHGTLSGILSGGHVKAKLTSKRHEGCLEHIGDEVCLDVIPDELSSIRECTSDNSTVANPTADRLNLSNLNLKDPESVQSESVYISIGIDPSRITSSLSSPDFATVGEAASTNFHVFQIALDKLSDVSYILMTVADLSSTQQMSQSVISESELSIQETKHSTSIIESALLEMESTTLELSLQDGTSAILNEEMLKDLTEGLPAQWTGSSIRPVFSTDHDGFSLNSLYRKTASVNSAVLLLIRDITNTTFGAVLSERMKCSTLFYGTGESCVFTWKPDFKRYDWTKKNDYFMRGAADCFLIGAKSGHSAIWFDGALKYGRSEATDTFDNPVLCGQSKVHISSGRNSRLPKSPYSSNEKCPSSVPFIIDKLEVWEMLS